MGGKVGRVSGGSGEGVSRFWRQPGGFTAYHNEHFTMWTRQGIELGPFTVAHEKKILIRQCTANKDPRTCTEDLGSFPRDLPFAPARSSRCAPSGAAAGTTEHCKIAVSFYRPSSSVCTCCPQDPLRLFRAPSGRCIWGRGTSGIGGQSDGSCRRCVCRRHQSFMRCAARFKIFRSPYKRTHPSHPQPPSSIQVLIQRSINGVTRSPTPQPAPTMSE